MPLYWCPEKCKRCGYMSSNDLCKACSLLEGLERGMSTAAIVRHTVPPLYLSPILFFGPQSDKGRRKLEAEGPAQDNLRTIPYFHPPITVMIDVPIPP